MEIEALNLEVRCPVKEGFCTHGFGLSSAPEFMSKTSGDVVNLKNNSQIDLIKEENASVVSSLLANLIDGISSSKVAVPEETWNIPANQVEGYVDDPGTQSVHNIGFHKAKLENGNKISQQISIHNSANDHLVPEVESKWEDDQESIDDLWNEMSSSQTNGMHSQNFRKSINSTANIARNDNESKHSQSESDEFTFFLTHPSSPGEFDGSNDMFSQIFQKNLVSKKQKVLHFGKTKPVLPGTQILPRSGPSSKPVARPFRHRVVSYSQNDRRSAFQRITEIEFGISPAVKQDGEESEVDLEGFAELDNKSQLACTLQDNEPDLFENTTDLADAESPSGNLDVNREETVIGNFASQSYQVASLKDGQDALESLAESLTEMSDIFDEEIDAAIENYVQTSDEVLGLCSASAHENPHHLRALDFVKLTKENIDVSTQTTISGSIYSSIRCIRVEESSNLKRSLQALCLENLLLKKPKTICLSSPTHSMIEESTEKITGYGESPNYGDNGEVLQQIRELKMPLERPAAFNFGNDMASSVGGKQNQNYSNNDKLEQDDIEDEVELREQEVPRNIVITGTLPIHSPSNFCWENDPKASAVNYDDDTDGDTLTKTKPPRRLRLGLSRRAKPVVSLHQFL